MGGWSCTTRDDIEWQGTLKAGKFSIPLIIEDVALDPNKSISLTTSKPTLTAEGLIKLKFDDGDVKNKAKAIIAYIDENDDEVIWLQTHDWLNDSSQHKHFSVEAADASGQKQTRLSVGYGADTVDVNTNQANFYVNGEGGFRIIDADFDGILKFSPITSCDIYPDSQSTRALRIQDGTTAINITGLGVSTIAFQDSITSTGTISGSNLLSSTYTPTISGALNLDSTPTATTAQYMRVGNVVTVSGRFTADPTNTTTNTLFAMSLPIASAMGAASQVAGTAFCGSIAGMGAEIFADASGDTAIVKWISSDTTSQTWSYSFTYLIV